MRSWFAVAMLLTIFLGGCGPELSQQDLGQVVFELPKVAGADKPYAPPPSSGVTFTTEEDHETEK
ncbi:MAG: hypothetical protein ABFC54_07105 [Thermoguttaceae bacterium]